MNEQNSTDRQRIWKGGCLSLLTMLVIGGYFAYRWVYTQHSNPTRTTSVTAPYTMRLEDGDYTSMSPTGKRAWFVHAKQIDFDRAPGSPLTNIDDIEITGLSDGRLYGERGDKPLAMFHAGHGEYEAGGHLLPVAALAPNYHLEWEFRLSDGVRVRTAGGDTLQAPSIVIVGVRNGYKAGVNQMLFCEEGATVTHHDISAHAVTARYDLQSRVVECMQGVNITLRRGNVLADRMFWMPNQHQIQIPENASGRLHDMSFTGSNVTIDTLKELFRSSHAHIQFHESAGAGVSLP